MILHGYLYAGAFTVNFKEDDDVIFTFDLKSVQKFNFLAKEGETWKFTDQQEFTKVIVNFCNELAMAFDSNPKKLNEKWFSKSLAKTEKKSPKEVIKKARAFPPKDEYI